MLKIPDLIVFHAPLLFAASLLAALHCYDSRRLVERKDVPDASRRR